MGKYIDITDERFGKLVAVRRIGSKNGRPLWLCKCDCGNTTYAETRNLRYGSTTSCGCRHMNILKTVAIKHNHYGERLYWVWHSMKQRVSDPARREYKYYGARGITMCKEWMDSYEVFREWAYSHGYDENAAFSKCTIDRIDVNGNYEPDNCRWVGMDVQRRNQRPRSKKCV